MLRYEHLIPGTRVRAYDYQPCKGRKEIYVEGVIARHDRMVSQDAKALVILADVDTMNDEPGDEEFSRVGQEVRIPMEVMFEDDWKPSRVLAV